MEAPLAESRLSADSMEGHAVTGAVVREAPFGWGGHFGPVGLGQWWSLKLWAAWKAGRGRGACFG